MTLRRVLADEGQVSVEKRGDNGLALATRRLL